MDKRSINLAKELFKGVETFSFEEMIAGLENAITKWKKDKTPENKNLVGTACLVVAIKADEGLLNPLRDKVLGELTSRAISEQENNPEDGKND